MEIGGELIT